MIFKTFLIKAGLVVDWIRLFARLIVLELRNVFPAVAVRARLELLTTLKKLKRLLWARKICRKHTVLEDKLLGKLVYVYLNVPLIVLWRKTYVWYAWNRNRNRKLLISRAPTKAKSQEPAYSQALNQNKTDRQQSRSRESGRQADRQSDGYGGWCLDLRRGGRYVEGYESG